MQLLQGAIPGLQKNQSFGPLQRSVHGGSSSKGSMAYEISRLRYHLGIRCCCEEGLPRSARANPSSLLQHSKTVEQAELSYSDAKAHGSSSHICRVLSSDIASHALSSAIEAHALTQLPIDPSGYPHQYFEPETPKNEEPEGPFHLPVAKLSALLRLSDTDHETDYFELLAVADYLERLGLDVYFRREIKSILDRVFRIWTESTSSEAASLLGDLEIVSLAFYLLRSHEYDVQPSIFNLYREDGRFCKRTQQAAVGDDTVSADVVDLLNLLRASGLRFRRDVVLQDAYKFASTTLSNMLDEPLPEKTSAEIMHRLKYPWGIDFRMLETRQTILNFQEESVTVNFSSSGRLSSKVVSLMLSTASQLFNHYISVFQQEIEDLQRWTKEFGLEAVNVRPSSILLPFQLGLAYDMPQAKYAYTRSVWAKTWYLLILQDDIYEGLTAASMEEVLVFMDAVKKFDPSIMEKLPQVERLKLMRVVYKAMYDVTISWAKESSIWHGRDLLRTIIDTWMVRLEIYVNEKRWMEYNYEFTTDKYMEEYGKWSFAAETAAPLAYYSIPGWKPSNAFLETRPDMEALFALANVGRLLNDAKTYQHEEVFDTGKAEYISLLMKENPHLTEADAVELTVKYAHETWEEFTEAILRSSIPHRQVKQIVLSNFRTTTLMYLTVDGLRSTDWLLAKLMDPLPNLTNKN